MLILEDWKQLCFILTTFQLMETCSKKERSPLLRSDTGDSFQKCKVLTEKFTTSATLCVLKKTTKKNIN